MGTRPEILSAGALRFFGEMSAANAHEIKNALAVINENAGLLEDLVRKADRGGATDLERLGRLSQAIQHQVARADHIARSINRFCHSVDRGSGPADLEQALVLVADMATRYATLRDVGLQVETPPTPVSLPVEQFALLHLLWTCLNATIRSCTAGDSLVMSGKRSKGRVRVRFGPLKAALEPLQKEIGALPEAEALLDSMNGRLEIDSSAKVLEMTLHIDTKKQA